MAQRRLRRGAIGFDYCRLQFVRRVAPVKRDSANRTDVLQAHAPSEEPNASLRRWKAKYLLLSPQINNLASYIGVSACSRPRQGARLGWRRGKALPGAPQGIKARSAGPHSAATAGR